MKVTINPFKDEHWTAVHDIYRHGLNTRNATFETEVPDFETWDRKYHHHLRWVAINNDTVAGWAGLLPVSPRKVYEGVVEISIYIHPGFTGLGMGRQLMDHLISESEIAGIWTLYASIFPENIASIKLHKSAGFREIGYREKIGKLDGKWRNTVLFERRSKITGV